MTGSLTNRAHALPAERNRPRLSAFAGPCAEATP